MGTNKYKFYMQKVDKNGNALDTEKNLEEDFDGLLYSRCEGLNKIGKPKNIYEETYSDADRVRVYMPDEITNETTEISLTLYFVGENRHSILDTFKEYIRNGFTKYWDTARNKSFIFYVNKDIDVSDEMWYGSKPYISATFKLQNINGKTTNVNE